MRAINTNKWKQVDSRTLSSWFEVLPGNCEGEFYTRINSTFNHYEEQSRSLQAGLAKKLRKH